MCFLTNTERNGIHVMYANCDTSYYSYTVKISFSVLLFDMFRMKIAQECIRINQQTHSVEEDGKCYTDMYLFQINTVVNWKSIGDDLAVPKNKQTM